LATTFDILLGAQTSLPVAELGRALDSELEALGRSTRIVHDRLRQPTTESATLIVAPHEALPVLAPADDERLVAALRRSILLVLAHPSSPEWTATLPYAEHAGALLHVSDAGIAAFKRLGRRVRRFPLGYHASFDRWNGTDGERPLEAVFLGTLTPRRARLLSEAAAGLARRRVELHVPGRPSTEAERVVDFVAGDEKLDLLRRSRTILDLHADEEPAFGWLRAVQAICNGCVLVAEAAGDCSPLQPDLHFVEAKAGRPREALDALLDDPGRIAELREHAYRFLRDELPLRNSVEPVLELADELPRPSLRRARGRQAGVAAVAAEPVPPATLTDERIDRLIESVTRQNSVLKKLFLDLRLLRRQVAQLSHSLADPPRPLVETSRTPAAEDGPTPDVSVIVTVHNYGRFVRDALESALASEDVAAELVVVDDASSDGSPRIVRTFMDERPGAAITLVEQRVNTGVQRARNLAFSLARAPLAFVLDADNAVYPLGIAKLRTALEADPGAGFAYGLIERFSEDRSLGLMNTSGWDPSLLAQEPYIDAMALVRVDGWRQVGGYVTEQSLELGWEDYDLWLSFAMAGFHGAYVREIVGRYRVHGVSSLTMTTLDTHELMAKLRERHRPFFAAVTERA
jgi:GT2 family glycosyltransferase